MTKTKDVRIRRITLSGEINDFSVGVAIDELFAAERKGKADRIELWITTYGGSVDAGFALIDAINELKLPVDIVAAGSCMSMGAYILQAGDRRYATPNTRLMIHSISSVFEGDIQQGKMQMRQVALLESNALKIVAKRVGMSVKDLKRFQGNIRFMSPEEALKHNFIDDIRRPPQ